MRILMIAPQPFFQPRGTPISVFQRLHGLSKLGCKIDLVTYHVGNDVEIPGVTIHRAPALPFIDNVKIGPSWAKILLDILVFLKTILMLLTNRYDVIHSHEEASFFCVVLAIVFRKRHIYDMHSILSQQLAGSSYGKLWPIVALFRLLEISVLRTCDAVITIGSDIEAYVTKHSPNVDQIMIENLPISTGENTVSPDQVEALREKLGLQGKIPVVYTGTFETYQGLDLLFDSIEIVMRHAPEIKFIMVGGKPHQVAYWQNEMKQRGLHQCTHFVGTVSPEESIAYLHLAEILVSPRIEGLSVPLKIYTYLHSGKPTVATRLYAHTQVLNDDMAMLVAPDKEEFAHGILQLAETPDLRRKLGGHAKEFAEAQYNITNYVAKLEQIYRLFNPSLAPLHSSSPIN